MKANKFMLGALAALAMGGMASCTSDEPVQGGSSADQTGDRYMAIRLTNPGNASSRALADDAANKKFETGDGVENEITTDRLRFYFFTETGQPFTLAASNVSGDVSYTNMVKPLSVDPNKNPGNSGDVANAVLVLGKADPNSPYVGTTPRYVVCVANLDTDAAFSNLANIDMRTLDEKLTSSDRDQDPSSWTLFKMSSSSYAKETTSPAGEQPTVKRSRKVMASEIMESHLCATPTEATANPVRIYIERLAAKVRNSGLNVYPAQTRDEDGNLVDATYDFTSESTTSGTTATITPTPLYVNLVGWRLVNRMTQAQLFKKIVPNEDYFPNWNDPDYHRCYWAITPENTEALRSTNLNLYSTTTKWYGNYDKEYPRENVAYTLPSTAWQPVATDTQSALLDRTANCTAIVMKGIVTKDKEGDEPVNFVRWAGQYYDLDVFKTVVMNAYKVQYSDTHMTVDDVTLKQQTGKNSYDVYVGDSRFSRFSDIQWWQDGVTSYYVNIKHAVQANGTPLFGVVRNHIYENKVTGVVGLGVPGENRENPTPEDESYVACELTVLDWRVISDEIVLE